MNTTLCQLGRSFMSVGEPTMQTETDVERMPESVVGPMEQMTQLSALGGLSLSFEPGYVNSMTEGEPIWKSVCEVDEPTELSNLSATICDPCVRGGQQTPLTPYCYGGTPQGNPIYQSFGVPAWQSLGSMSAMSGESMNPQHNMERPHSSVVFGCTYPPDGWHPHLSFSPEGHTGTISQMDNIPRKPGEKEGLPHGVRLPQRRGATQLWEFLLEMLNKEGNESVISWLNKDIHEFCVLDPDELGRRWGELKGRPRMNYDKLSRSLRYYYQKKLIMKVPTEKHVYRFLCSPEILYDALGRRDKKLKKGFMSSQDDLRCETSPSPTNTDVSHSKLDSESSNDHLHLQLEEVALSKSGTQSINVLLRKRLQSQSKSHTQQTAPLWRPPSPPSPAHPHTNKISTRPHPYLPRRSLSTSILSTNVAKSFPNDTIPIPQPRSESGISFLSSGMTCSLPANVSLLPCFSPDHSPDDSPNPESPACSDPYYPNSPHSIVSDISDNSETKSLMMEFVESCMNDNNFLDLLYYAENPDQLHLLPDKLQPLSVAALAPLMPPFKN